MLLASNRAKVLKAIAKLEEKLKDAGIKVVDVDDNNNDNRNH